jgi:hypothetical protein
MFGLLVMSMCEWMHWNSCLGLGMHRKLDMSRSNWMRGKVAQFWMNAWNV